jgi:hypothetical protein
MSIPALFFCVAGANAGYCLILKMASSRQTRYQQPARNNTHIALFNAALGEFIDPCMPCCKEIPVRAHQNPVCNSTTSFSNIERWLSAGQLFCRCV